MEAPGTVRFAIVSSSCFVEAGMEGVYRLEVGAESLVISGSYREMSVNAAYSKVHVTLGSVSVKIMSPVVSGVCVCVCVSVSASVYLCLRVEVYSEG